MQISKCFLVVCAAACCTAVLPLRAADADNGPSTNSPPPVAQPPPAVTQPAPTNPPPVDPESIAKAREALHQQMKELESQPPAATVAPIPSPKMATSQPGQKPVDANPQETGSKTNVPPKAEKVSKKPAKATLSFQPIPAPPPALSADKETRLTELLRKYKADELTPEVYHQQRAKILSEP